MGATGYRIIVTLKRLSPDVCKIIVPLPKPIPLHDPAVARLTIDLAAIIPDRGFLIAQDGKLIGVGFSDKEAADFFFKWVDWVMGDAFDKH